MTMTHIVTAPLQFTTLVRIYVRSFADTIRIG